MITVDGERYHYYCRHCDIYGFGAECWWCKSTSLDWLSHGVVIKQLNHAHTHDQGLKWHPVFGALDHGVVSLP